MRFNLLVEAVMGKILDCDNICCKDRFAGMCTHYSEFKEVKECTCRIEYERLKKKYICGVDGEDSKL